MTFDRSPGGHGQCGILCNRSKTLHPARRMPWLALAMASALLLAGCEMGDGRTGEASRPAPTSTEIIVRDVEAPELFQTSDLALWDGQMSLGGIWIASPDAEEPGRVIARNPANGRFVIGTLFRREHHGPGPKLHLSSDAAETLDIGPGIPTRITLTALRREESTLPAAPSAPVLDSNVPIGASVADYRAPVAPSAAEAAVAPGTRAPHRDGITTTALPAAPTATAAAASAAPTGPRLIQIGLFSQEANAERAVQSLKKSGIEASIRKETVKGRNLWNVTARGNSDMLKTIRASGFADAYLSK